MSTHLIGITRPLTVALRLARSRDRIWYATDGAAAQPVVPPWGYETEASASALQ